MAISPDEIQSVIPPEQKAYESARIAKEQGVDPALAAQQASQLNPVAGTAPVTPSIPNRGRQIAQEMKSRVVPDPFFSDTQPTQSRPSGVISDPFFDEPKAPEQPKQPEDKSFISDAYEIGKQLVIRGPIQLAEMLGKAGQAFSGGAIGGDLRKSAEEMDNNWQPDMEGRGPVASALIRGAPNVVPSLALAVPYIVAPEIGIPAAVATVLGDLGTIALFGGSAATDTMEKVDAVNQNKDDSIKAGFISGFSNGVLEAVQNRLALPVLGAGARALKAGMQGVIGDTVETGVIKPLVTAYAKAMVGEPLTEDTQDIITELAERHYGAKPTDLWEIIKDSTTATMGMVTLTAPLGIVGHYQNSKRAASINTLLSDPSQPKEARQATVGMLYQQGKETGVKDADKWYEGAKQDIENGLPIRRDSMGNSDPSQADAVTVDAITNVLSANQKPAPTTIEQARIDAEAINAGQIIPDKVRTKNATLISLYGDNDAARQAIETGNQTVIDSMLRVAPTVEQARQSRLDNQGILTEIAKADTEQPKTAMEAAFANLKEKQNAQPVSNEQPDLRPVGESGNNVQPPAGVGGSDVAPLGGVAVVGNGLATAAEVQPSVAESNAARKPDVSGSETLNKGQKIAEEVRKTSVEDVNPDLPLKRDVYVVDQINPETQQFDGHKVITGAKGFADAKEIYDAKHSKETRGAVTKMSPEEYKAWAKTKPSEPVKYVAPKEKESVKEEKPAEKAPEAIAPEAKPEAAIEPEAKQQIKILSDGRYAAVGFTPEQIKSADPKAFIDGKGTGIFPAKTNKIQLERALGISTVPENAILAEGDRPFEKRKQAKLVIDSTKGMKKTHQIVQIDGGYAVVPKEAKIEQASKTEEPQHALKESADNGAIYSTFKDGRMIRVAAKGVAPAMFGAKFEKQAKEYYEGLKAADDPKAFAEEWSRKVKADSAIQSDTESKPSDKAKAKKLEVLKAQAQGKISGDQGAALKELADAGEHAAVDEVLKPDAAKPSQPAQVEQSSAEYNTTDQVRSLEKYHNTSRADAEVMYEDGYRVDPETNDLFRVAPKEVQFHQPSAAYNAFETIYRGEYAGNKNGFFYTNDAEWARNFTQGGRDEEIIQAKIKSGDIYTPKELLYAGDDDLVKVAIAEAKNKGFKAVRLSEGQNEPPSIFVFDKSALKLSTRYVAVKDNVIKKQKQIKHDYYKTDAGNFYDGNTPITEEEYNKAIKSAQAEQSSAPYLDNSNNKAYGENVKGANNEQTNAKTAGRESGELRAVNGLPPKPGFKELTKIRSRDKSGPLVLYRGARPDLVPEHFADKALGYNSKSAPSGRGVHLTDSPSHAQYHADLTGGKVTKYYVDIRNPFVYKTDAPNAPRFDTAQEFTAWRNKLIDGTLDGNKYDGIVEIARQPDGKGWNNVIAFDPHQIIPVPNNNTLYQESAPYKNQTETPEFKKWFGDSKVVYADGKPLVVYHGTGSDITEFSKAKAHDKEGRAAGVGYGKRKFYLTSDTNIAAAWAKSSVQRGAWMGKNIPGEKYGSGESPNIMPLFVSIKNPITNDEYSRRLHEKTWAEEKQYAYGLPAKLRDKFIAELDAELKKEGVDGIYSPGDHNVIAFNPTQIKSAIGNRGTFDQNDPNILHQKSGAYHETGQKEFDFYAQHDTRPDTTDEQKRLGESAIRDILGPYADRTGTSVLGSRIAADFKAQGGASLIGQVANTSEDLAVLAQVVRDPRFEKFRIFFTKSGKDMAAFRDYQTELRNLYGNDENILERATANQQKILERLGAKAMAGGKKIVGHTAVTSEAPGMVSVVQPMQGETTDQAFDRYTQEIERQMKTLGADGYYLLHNHPSGKAEPSTADLHLTSAIAEKVPGFLSHVVIDHNEYSEISANGEYQTKKKEFKQWFNKDNHEIPHNALNKSITKPSDIANIGKMIESKKGFFTMIGRGADGTVSAIAEVPVKMLDGGIANESLLTDTMKRFAAQTGSTDIFAVAEKEYMGKLVKLVAKGKLLDAIAITEAGKSLELSAQERGVSPRGTLFESGKSIAAEQKTSPYAKETPEETHLQATQRLWQDKMIRFEVIQQAKEMEAAKTGGYLGKDIHEARIYMLEHGIHNPISEATNVHQAESLRSGIASSLAEDFREKKMEPLIRAVHDAGVTMEDVSNFLKIQHTPEANERIRKVRGDDSTAFGITDDEAKAEMDAYKARPDYAKLKEVADKWRALTDEILQMKVDAELIPQSQADAYKATFQMYVPMKGEDEVSTGTGKGLSVVAKDKRRLGHGLRDERIIENIIQDYEKTINLIEKNKVGKVALNFINEINDPSIGTVGKPVKRQVFMPGAKHYMVMYHGTDVQSFDNFNDARVYVTEESDKYNRKKSDYYIDQNADEGRVILQAKPILADNEFQVYVNGEAVRAQWNDPLLAQAYKNLGVDHVNKLLEGAREFNSLLSKAYTGYSPTFMLKNPIRDAIQGAITNTSKLGAGTAAKIFAAYPHAMKELSMHFKEHGASAEVNKYRKMGGSTGASYVSDIERIGNDVMSAYNEYAGAANTYKRTYAELKAKGRSEATAKTIAAMKAGKAGFLETPIIGHFLRLMEHANAVTENALRLATFNTLIKEKDANGNRKFTDSQAALYAKDLMNFNRKGELTTQAGALYLFFNPNIQGTHVLVQALTTAKHRNQARVLAGTMVLSAYLMAEAMRGGGDDDEKKWKRINSNLKDHNMIFGFGDTKVMLPVPYGYGVFHALGNVISDYAHGESGWKLGIRMTASMFENFSPVGNPVDSSHEAYQLLPTIPKMVMAPSVNENSFGTPISPDKHGQENKPDNQNMYRNTKGTLYADIAAGLNTMSGGTKYSPGLVDISPETLRFWMSSLTGGAGQFAIDAINTGMVGYQGTTPEIKEIPVIKAFTHRDSIGDARRAFWDEANKAKEASDEFALARKAHDVESAKKIIEDKKPLIALSHMVNRLEPMIKRIRDAEDLIRLDDKMSLDMKRAQIKQLEEKETQVYDAFLTAVAKSR